MKKGLVIYGLGADLFAVGNKSFVVCCYYLYSLWKRKFKSRQGLTQFCSDENLFEHTIGRWDPKKYLSGKPYYTHHTYSSTMNYLTGSYKIYGVLSQSLTEQEHVCLLTKIYFCVLMQGMLYLLNYNENSLPTFKSLYV